MVRKSNLTYDREKDIILFLERLNEFKDTYNTPSDRLSYSIEIRNKGGIYEKVLLNVLKWNSCLDATEKI